MEFIYLFISFFASLVGAISGIGGGIIIKPVLDSFSSFNISTIGFLSGCTVLSMATVTFIRGRKSNIQLNSRISTLLAIGGIVGGIVGKRLFDSMKIYFNNDKVVGLSQNSLLIIMTISVLIFTIFKRKIIPKHKDGIFFTLIAGLILGSVAAFLGIGGGPINLAILYYFFSMNSKTAALSSIYIIFLSQLTSLIYTILSGNIPEFNILILILMIFGGIFGGLVGSKISKKITHSDVDKLFIFVLSVIVIICSFNLIKLT